MEQPAFHFIPTFDPEAVRQALSLLLTPGRLAHEDLERRLRRLDDRFRTYAATYPLPLWAPGLRLSDDMRLLTETYLPHAEIRRAFQRLYSCALTFPPCIKASLPHATENWLDLLEQLRPQVMHPNPARLIRQTMTDAEMRIELLFGLFLPKAYGGGFDRYPAQSATLGKWLAAGRARRANGIRCLDAACGCGEGTYDLLQLLRESGYPPERVEIHGTTLEPFELFAASHGFFPHDRERQRQFRHRVEQLLARMRGVRLSFRIEDLSADITAAGEYDVILCNGLIGGPLLHDEREVVAVIGRLARRLAPRGILLIADRFHGGWKRKIPPEQIAACLRQSGLKPLCAGEGIGGEKPA